MDDPRIKRVLKRYRKNEQFPDASIDVSGIPTVELMKACSLQDADSLASPKELDSHASAHLSKLMGVEFEREQFDYFLHSYLRSEFAVNYHQDPKKKSCPAPENGPPTTIPIPDGMRWCSARPKNGEEHYIAVEIQKSDGADGKP